MTSNANPLMSEVPALRRESEKNRLVLLVTGPGAPRAARFFPSFASSLARAAAPACTTGLGSPAHEYSDRG